MSYGLYFLLSVLTTLVIEVPVLFLVSKYLLKAKIRTKEVLYWGVLVNLLSLPYLWFVFPLFIPARYYILIGEILVFLIEAVVLSQALKISFKNTLIMSFPANLASYLAGLILLR